MHLYLESRPCAKLYTQDEEVRAKPFSLWTHGPNTWARNRTLLIFTSSSPVVFCGRQAIKKADRPLPCPRTDKTQNHELGASLWGYWLRRTTPGIHAEYPRERLPLPDGVTALPFYRPTGWKPSRQRAGVNPLNVTERGSDGRGRGYPACN